MYWVDLNPVIGGEISKIRPAVVVSDDSMNRYLNTVVVCPMTSQLHADWRSRIIVPCNNKHSEIAVDQIRTISKLRIKSKIDSLNNTDAALVRELINTMYGTA